MDKTIEERVAWGAAWLDDHYPRWWQGIDLATLDISKCNLCVLGQVYTGVIPAAERSQITAQAIVNLTLGDAEWIEEYYAELASGSMGGYHILTDFHGIIGDGVGHGFVTSVDYPYDEQAEQAEYRALLDEWTRVVIRRRLNAEVDMLVAA